MARSLSLFTKSISTRTSPFSLSTLRFQSSHSPPNLNPDDDTASDAQIRKLEDAIHHLIVRRSAPDWLPFIPGSSYWVPPSRSTSVGIAQLVERLANPMTDEESLASTSPRGWPSSDYFIQGHSLIPEVNSPLTEVKVSLVSMEEESPSSNLSKLEETED